MKDSNRLNNTSEAVEGQGVDNEWESVSDVEFAGDKAENDAPEEPGVADIAKQGWAKMTGYYKNNPDKINELVSEYLANDNGAEVPGVNEVAEQGWAKMTGYYKKNPDKIGDLAQAYLANMKIAEEKAKAEAEEKAKTPDDKAYEEWSNMTKEELDARSDAYANDFAGETNINGNTGKERSYNLFDIYPRLEGESKEDYGKSHQLLKRINLSKTTRVPSNFQKSPILRALPCLL